MIARQHTATDPNTALDTLASWLAEAQHIAVLTGAGMSTESGIPDFRSYQGRYTQNASLAEVLSIDYFQHNPAGFWQAFKEIFELKLVGNKQPNAGHRFLAWLETQGKTVSVLTQNIDGLHQCAGSRAVVSATRPSLLSWSIQRSSASTIITMIASVVRNSSTLPCGP